jgi:hypothetical protein
MKVKDIFKLIVMIPITVIVSYGVLKVMELIVL